MKYNVFALFCTTAAVNLILVYHLKHVPICLINHTLDKTCNLIGPTNIGSASTGFSLFFFLKEAVYLSI